MRRPAALLLFASVACEPFVRSNEQSADAGTPAFSVLDINGFLVPPGTPIAVSPNPIATSPKFYLRKPSGAVPDCYYGVFVADVSAAGQPNDGVLISALGDMNKINNDPSLGGSGRTSCPEPSSYAVGGPIPDGIQIGDRLAVAGFFEPYCDYYNTSLGQCQYDLFPEVTPDPPAGQAAGSVSNLGAAPPLPPLVVSPTDISDLATEAIQYAAELVQVQNVTVSSLPLDPYGDVVLDQGDLWLASLSPTVTILDAPGTAFCSVTGDLHFQFGHWKLRPRQQSDLVRCTADQSCCSDGQCHPGGCPDAG